MKQNAKRKVVRKQPRKDSKTRRVNFDNVREDKFVRDIEKDIEGRSVKSKSNDVRWYANNAELLKAAASIPFSPVVGRRLPYYQDKDNLVNYTIPGVMTVTWSPCVGASDDNAINQAANSIYSFTVHANSRNQSYDAPDEMVLIMAGAQVFSAIALGIRAFGTMRRFAQEDMYTPNALIKAMGFDYNDLSQNYSKMWFDLNEIIARAQQIWIPNTMPVIERWFWMNSNIYRDGKSVKAQYYMYTPEVFYKYDEKSVTTGSALIPVPWLPINSKVTMSQITYNTWASYLELVNSMINALLNSQDRGIIFGDILKAYGADKLYSLSPISADYMLEPTYDEEVLTQFENLTTFNFQPQNIQQDTNGNLLQGFKPSVNETLLSKLINPKALVPSGPTNQVLNFHQREVPTPEQIMVATRMKVMGSKVSAQGASGVWTPVTAGTEVATALLVTYNDWTSGTPFPSVYLFNQYLFTYTTDGKEYTNETVPNIYTVLLLWTAFDWAPWIYRLASHEVEPNYVNNVRMAYGDYDNYTFMDAELLKKIHTTAIYSEYGVPSSI